MILKKTPPVMTLNKMLNQMAKFSKNIKIVTNAKSVRDPAHVLALYARVSKINLIAFAMGDHGKMSRILCLYLGSPFTYVSLGKAIAPGQFSLAEVKSIVGKK